MKPQNPPSNLNNRVYNVCILPVIKCVKDIFHIFNWVMLTVIRFYIQVDIFLNKQIRSLLTGWSTIFLGHHKNCMSGCKLYTVHRPWMIVTATCKFEVLNVTYQHLGATQMLTC